MNNGAADEGGLVRHSEFGEEDFEPIVRKKRRGGRGKKAKVIDIRESSCNSFFPFSLRPEEQKMMVKNEEGVLTQNKL